MKPNSPPAKKKLSMKTRLMVIVVVFVLINIIFYVGFDRSEDSQDVKDIELENEVIEEPEEEPAYANFNPPKP
jgi:flagellar basal body-associated protein FliL